MNEPMKIDNQTLAKTAIRKAFPGIYEAEVDTMVEIGSFKQYPSGICLCQEGAVEETFYILLDGEVLVTKEINSVENRLLKQLYPGDFFGEMGLIHDAPRAASVTTTSPVKVLEIDKSSFNQTLQQMSMVSMAMVREVSRRLRENDEMAIEDLREKAGELAEAYQQLAELEVARREFLTTIAHELRTPLTSANGYLQMVQMGMFEGEQLDHALDSISGNLQRIIGLTNDILFLQEMDLIFSEFEQIDLAVLFETLLSEYQGTASEMGVTLEMQAESKPAVILGDLKSIERAFRALVDNAIKFSLNGGKVGVHIRKRGQEFITKISDEGIGIRPEDLPRIYERFWRTEDYNGHLFAGIGLGLSIAKQVVWQHGGRIDLESTPGEGTTFTVTLPERFLIAQNS